MTLPKEVILKALKACRDVYPHKNDYLVDRSVDGYTILAVEGTNETTDWITNLKFLIKRDDCHRGFKNNANRTLVEKFQVIPFLLWKEQMRLQIG